jgi:serine acetyltransferase
LKAKSYPRNPNIRNGPLAEAYLFCLRHRLHVPARFLGLALACEIRCVVPERLFIPHPAGVVVGVNARIANNVVLMQHVTLGCRAAFSGILDDDGDPTINEGAYIGPGAKIFGKISIGEWSIIGANAVVTENIPPYSIVVGCNKILSKTTKELLPTSVPVYARDNRDYQSIAG